ncbi:uncharacterized protein CC84DRAFT_1222030 [Paraphaeosphaeria sporulosa]|uniref:Uncharacterized protein n=1 Tax=Paraphaeosphaeria sporulosa TaxID=1460663 RepID=A0A177BZE0_9PLEO|nr:uncharacterized protein CC84DRAFT_1222030 [Paraphaeosphaeria sporulosa]OAG00526.1 hypothetical protein CC84DRAFT_1222030 [Paraphaeosphaeria sporulosa]
MALGGYKHVARASLFGGKRAQQRGQKRQPEEQILGCSPTSSNAAPKQKLSHKLEQTGSPLGATDSQKKGKRKLSTPEKERFKSSESWNSEQQRLRNEKKKQLKKLKKQQRRRERKKRSPSDPRAKPMETVEETAKMQKEGAVLENSEAASESESHSFPIRVVEVDEGMKYDLAVKFGWIDPKEDNSGSMQDNFVDSAYGNDHHPQLPRKNTVTLVPDTLHEIIPPRHQSPPIDYVPRTPTNSPSPQEPMTPNRPIRTPDVLVVTPSRRRPSPQLEFIVSPKSSAGHQAAANMLVALKSRTARLNTQIAGFNTHLLGLLNRLTLPAKETRSDSTAKAKVLRKIITAMEEHSNQVFMMEFALRDLVDEGYEDLSESLKKTEGEFVELVKVYERKVYELMGKLSPGALEKTMRDPGDTQSVRALDPEQ